MNFHLCLVPKALGMGMVRRLQRAGEDLSLAQSRLASERREREASVSALEATLKKLRDEHMVATVSICLLA